MRIPRLLLYLAAAFLAGFLLIQLIPIDKTNPSITREVRWDSDQTRALAQRACFDCHSNETVWPWYTNIAPPKFMVANHVRDGREHLNFSEWDRPQHDPDEVAELIEDGDMPLRNYLLMHPEAVLSEAEQQQLIDGLEATFAQDPPIEDEHD